MMVVHNHFRVEINVDGTPANEYDNDDDTAPDTAQSVTKYVEAVPGKEFYFAIKLDPFYEWGAADVIVAKCWMDGKQCRGICLEKSVVMPYPHVVHKIDGEWSGSGSNAKVHRFVFADLQTRMLIPHQESPLSHSMQATWRKRMTCRQ